tara:strand:- start:2191 stop:2865 length:675 start_codon:yes stop_codon:yes gene_type:complete
MQKQISKKIFVYFFLFLLLGTINNKYFLELKYNKIHNINISGLDEIENTKLLRNLESLNLQNIFFLEKNEIQKKLDSIEIIHDYSVLKTYPSSLNIKINKTKFLANVTSENKIFLLGANGKLIETNNYKKDLPNIFGKYDKNSFFNLLKSIDNSKFGLKNIKNLYFFKSKRWDIETNSGTLIRLPKYDLEKSLNLSLEIMESSQFNKISILDLRQKNQVIIDGK